MSEAKKITLQERLAQVRKELTGVKADLHEFARSGRMPARRADLGPTQKPAAFTRTATPSTGTVSAAGGAPRLGVGSPSTGRAEPPRSGTPRAPQTHDDRFVDYLSASIQVGKPLRSARQTQRSIVIALFIVLVLVALWVAGMLL